MNRQPIALTVTIMTKFTLFASRRDQWAGRRTEVLRAERDITGVGSVAKRSVGLKDDLGL